MLQNKREIKTTDQIFNVTFRPQLFIAHFHEVFVVEKVNLVTSSHILYQVHHLVSLS